MANSWSIYRCIEMVRSSVYAELASELEITKALTFLRLMDIPKVLKIHMYSTLADSIDRTCNIL